MILCYLNFTSVEKFWGWKVRGSYKGPKGGPQGGAERRQDEAWNSELPVIVPTSPRNFRDTEGIRFG